jgi:prepilin peptidase CpaA
MASPESVKTILSGASHTMPLLSSIPAVVVLVAALIAAVTDVWKFKVYNALTLPLLASGLIYHAVVGGWYGLGNSAVGMVFGFAILLVFYTMGGMGAGDVKLMAAIGAWLGMPMTFYVFVASALAGGVYAIALLVMGGGVQESIIHMQILWCRMRAFSRHLGSDAKIEAEVKRDDRRKRLIPFAAMVALGVVATFAWLQQNGRPPG